MKESVFPGTGLAVLLFLVLLVEQASAGEISREPLDRVWEEHMLAGTFAVIVDGQRREDISDRSFESAMGMPSAVAFTRQGIAVHDLRETRLLGLWRKGGWELEGGLLAKVEERVSTFELYGKAITRIQPIFILDLKRMHAPKEEYWFEFFLLQRKRGGSRATVLKKWIFRPEELRRLGDGLPAGVSGFLQYDPATRMATVIIEGLTRRFEEQINLAGVLRE